MIQDRYGLPLSTASAAAGQAYVEGVDRFLAAQPGAEDCFERAVGADPAFALAHIGWARSLQLLGKVAPAQEAAERARDLAASLDRRERQHAEALGLAVAGQGARALALIREHLAEFPRDAIALAAANGVYGLIGFGGRPTRNEELDQLVGGCAAQRDLFEHTLLTAYLRTGRETDARARLARRVGRRPSVPVAAA